MNENKPVIPREVADAIQEMRSEYGWSDDDFFEWDNYEYGTLYNWAHGNPARFAAAIVNGYEVEKSAHDRIRDTYALHEAAANVGSTFARDFNFGVRFVLNTLGIKISGVNAPEEDVK